MTEDQLAFAYVLAVSQVPSAELCDEATFSELFVNQQFTRVERELIGTEAFCIRGDESYDWVDIGTTVEYYDRIEFRRGVVTRFFTERTYTGSVRTCVAIQPRRIGQAEVILPIHRIQEPRMGLHQ